MSPAPQAHYLLFSSGADWYGVPADRAAEIVAVDSVTRLPGAPPQVIGVFAHRGEVIPIIDLVLLRSGAGGDASRAVIVRAKRGAFALTVTRVFGVTPLTASHERMGEAGLLAQLTGPVRAHDRDVALVDVEGLFELLKG
jgi:purine-binding chemotaxis protein CheW